MLKGYKQMASKMLDMMPKMPAMGSVGKTADYISVTNRGIKRTGKKLRTSEPLRAKKRMKLPKQANRAMKRTGTKLASIYD